jgi:transposase InsO family protein
MSPIPDAETAVREIDGWVEYYNESHPHSALKMASPGQFIKALSQIADLSGEMGGTPLVQNR